MKKTLSILLAAALCILTAAPARAAAASAYDRPGQKLLALTFDDGPGAYSDAILDVLRSHGAKATFFVNGNKVSTYADQIKRMAAEGHQIGNHTYSHPNLSKTGSDEVKRQISSTTQALEKVLGSSGAGSFLRPPYGAWNKQTASAAGAPLVLWSVDTQDWKYQDSDRLVSYTTDTARDGDIVLMHETHKSTARGLDRLLTSLEGKGFEFVTVQELLWRRGVAAQEGHAYYSARNTGVERCERSLWFDESRLETHWAYPAIAYAEENGLMSRNEAGEFLPQFPLTRAMFVTVLGRLYGGGEASASAAFADVPADHYAAPYVAWASANGIMNGVSANRFAPDAPITRQELAVVAARCAKRFGASEGVTAEAPDYADRDAIAPWAADSVALCRTLGVLTGSNGRFDPEGVTTRAMGAVVLERLAKLGT